MPETHLREMCSTVPHGSIGESPTAVVRSQVCCCAWFVGYVVVFRLPTRDARCVSILQVPVTGPQGTNWHEASKLCSNRYKQGLSGKIGCVLSPVEMSPPPAGPGRPRARPATVQRNGATRGGSHHRQATRHRVTAPYVQMDLRSGWVVTSSRPGRDEETVSSGSYTGRISRGWRDSRAVKSRVQVRRRRHVHCAQLGIKDKRCRTADNQRNTIR